MAPVPAAPMFPVAALRLSVPAEAVLPLTAAMAPAWSDRVFAPASKEPPIVMRPVAAALSPMINDPPPAIPPAMSANSAWLRANWPVTSAPSVMARPVVWGMSVTDADV